MKSGPEELLLKLKDLEAKVSGKYMRTALRAGAKVIRTQMVADAPVKSGATRAAVKLKAMRRSRTRVGMMISVGAGWFKGTEFYAGFVEFGHRIGKRLSKGKLAATGDTRGTVPGKQWMHGAFTKSIGTAAETVLESLQQQMKTDEIGGK